MSFAIPNNAIGFSPLRSSDRLKLFPGTYKGKEGVVAVVKRAEVKTYFFPLDIVALNVKHRMGAVEKVYQEGFDNNKTLENVVVGVRSFSPNWNPPAREDRVLFFGRLAIPQPSIDLPRLLYMSFDHGPTEQNPQNPDNFLIQYEPAFVVNDGQRNIYLVAGNHRITMSWVNGIRRGTVSSLFVPRAYAEKLKNESFLWSDGMKACNVEYLITDAIRQVEAAADNFILPRG